MDILIVGLLFLVTLFLYIQSITPVYHEQDCTCGKYEKCVSKIKITGKGRMSRDPQELIKCGRVEKQMEHMNKVFKDEG